MIILGLVNFLEHFFPKFPVKMELPKAVQGPVMSWLKKATLPAVFIGGFLVGLCTFPCSGSIYVGITTLLAATQTFFRGVVYLLLYNLAFIAPLLPILALVGNRSFLTKVAAAHQRNSRLLKLALGLFSLVFGVGVFIFLYWLN